MVIENIGGPISWEQLSQIVAIVMREALWQRQAIHVNEEEGVAFVEVAPALDPKIYHIKKGTASPTLPPSKRVATC